MIVPFILRFHQSTSRGAAMDGLRFEQIMAATFPRVP